MNSTIGQSTRFLTSDNGKGASNVVPGAFGVGWYSRFALTVFFDNNEQTNIKIFIQKRIHSIS